MEIPNHKLVNLLELYRYAVECNEEEEYTSAPSGEFAEYNQFKLELEARESELHDAIQCLGYKPYQLAKILGLEK